MKQAVTSCLSAFGMQRKQLWMKYNVRADFKCITKPLLDALFALLDLEKISQLDGHATQIKRAVE